MILNLVTEMESKEIFKLLIHSEIIKKKVLDNSNSKIQIKGKMVNRDKILVSNNIWWQDKINNNNIYLRVKDLISIINLILKAIVLKCHNRK